jgi:hypothetical protein
MFIDMNDGLNSPFIVPVAGTIMILGIVAVSKIHDGYIRNLQYEERMAAIAKGLPMPELPPAPSEEKRVDLKLRMANIRLGGIITTAGSVAVFVFFCLLAVILKERDVLAGAAAALVPLAIGVGLLIDARAQAREIAYSSTSLGDPYPPQ